MGTKYSSVSISGYNSSPPPDDGSTGADNQITWAKSKEKLGDPVKTAVESINSALVTALNTEARSITVSDSSVAGDNAKTIEIASTVSTSVVTLSLGDAASMANGYIVSVVNRSAYNQTISRVTTANGIAGTATNVLIPPKGAMAFAVNASSDGYNILSKFIESTLSSETSLTSTSTDLTIPPGVTEFDVFIEDSSTNGTDAYLLQLGDSGGIEATGYSGGTSVTEGPTTQANSIGFIAGRSVGAADTFQITANFKLKDAASNTWRCEVFYIDQTAPGSGFGVGYKTLSGTLTTLRATTSGGTNTFDAGTICVRYEG
jgi:hypothetical protein